MGVGVSRVTTISAFDDLWRRAILFFCLLSSCLVCFSPAILQKCAAVNTNSAPAVNYSFHPWRSSVLTTLKCTSFDHWRGPSLGLAVPERRSTLPNYQRNCSGISLPLERRKALTLELCSQKWVPCGERLYPTTAENLRWRLDAWSPPLCPQAAKTTTIQVLDFVRFKSALLLSLSSLILAQIYI